MSTAQMERDDLENEHEALLSFMYLSPVGMVRTDASGTVEMMNPLAAQFLMPLVADGRIGNLFDSLSSVAPELRSLVSSFDADRGRICENHRVFVKQTKEGPVVLACSIVKVAAKTLMVVLSDISRQVAAERRARQTESWLAGICTGVNDFAFFSLDSRGLIETWNSSVERLTSFTEADVVGSGLPLFYARGEPASHWSLEHIALTRDEGWHVEEFWCETKGGRRFWGQLLIAALRETGDGISGYSVVLRDITERKVNSDNLERLLTTDHLTGATNRAHFFAVAESETARAKKRNRPLSIVMLDADHFKRINDTAGHQAGDEVLKQIAAQARAVLRASDVVARIGGEEFVLLLPGSTMSEAMAVAERLRRAVESASIVVGERRLSATISLGGASSADGSSTLEELLADADKALYDAKRAGRNCVRWSSLSRDD